MRHQVGWVSRGGGREGRIRRIIPVDPLAQTGVGTLLARRSLGADRVIWCHGDLHSGGWRRLDGRADGRSDQERQQRRQDAEATKEHGAVGQRAAEVSTGAARCGDLGANADSRQGNTVTACRRFTCRRAQRTV
jgi:hypothetical protein